MSNSYKRTKRRRCTLHVTHSPSIYRSGCLETVLMTSLIGTTPADRRGRINRPYNPRNTDDPKDIEYRVEDRIEEHSEDVQLKQSILDETYKHWTSVERTNRQSRTAASGASTHTRTGCVIWRSVCVLLPSNHHPFVSPRSR